MKEKIEKAFERLWKVRALSMTEGTIGEDETVTRSLKRSLKRDLKMIKYGFEEGWREGKKDQNPSTFNFGGGIEGQNNYDKEKKGCNKKFEMSDLTWNGRRFPNCGGELDTDDSQYDKEPKAKMATLEGKK